MRSVSLVSIFHLKDCEDFLSCCFLPGKIYPELLMLFLEGAGIIFIELTENIIEQFGENLSFVLSIQKYRLLQS